MQHFPQRGRGLGHVTPKSFGIRLNISSNYFFIHSFILFTEHRLHKNNIKNKRTKSVP